MLSLAAWLVVTERVADAERDAFEATTDQTLALVRYRLDSYASALSSTRGFFEASSQVDRDEWTRFAEELQLPKRFPGLRGLAFIEVVSHAAIDRFLEERRAEDPGYALQPPGFRPLYGVVRYVAPLEPNRHTLGLDIRTRATARTAQDRARDTGHMTMTPSLINEPGRTDGLTCVIYLPVYRKNAIIETIFERRRALRGWIGGPVVLSGLLADLPRDQNRRVQMQISDVSQELGHQVLYDEGASVADAPGWMDFLNIRVNPHAKRDILFGGRDWQVTFTPQTPFMAGLQWTPLLVLGVGCLASLCLSGYIFSIAEATRRAERTAAQRALELTRSEAQFRGTFDHAAIGMAIVGTDGSWVRVNQAMCKLLGYTHAQLLATDFQSLTHPEDLDTDLQLVRDTLEGRIHYYHMEKRYLHRDGHAVWAMLSVSLLRDEAGQPVHFVAQVQDITAAKEREAQLRQRADYDSLTGLYKRSELRRRLECLIDYIKEAPEHTFAVVYLDLDGFKPINDQHGHHIGDEVLKAVSGRLLSLVRKNRNDLSMVARIGGDEFAVLLDRLRQPSDAQIVIDRITRAFAEPLCVDDLLLHVGISAGSAASDGHFQSVADMLHAADTAMYTDKARRKQATPNDDGNRQVA